jgi:hypothetical protein
VPNYSGGTGLRQKMPCFFMLHEGQTGGSVRRILLLGAPLPTAIDSETIIKLEFLLQFPGLLERFFQDVAV